MQEGGGEVEILFHIRQLAETYYSAYHPQPSSYYDVFPHAGTVETKKLETRTQQ
jgi:hypothetical protein